MFLLDGKTINIYASLSIPFSSTRQKVDEHGQPMFETVPLLDKDGNPLLDIDGDPIVEQGAPVMEDFVDSNIYPPGYFADPEARATVGITEVPDPVREDDRFYYVQDNGDGTVTNTPKSLEQLQAVLLGIVNGGYEARIQAIKDSYPPSEVLSWPKQEEEARAYQADNTVQGPFITNLAQERGITVAELVTKIIAKADAFAVISGQLTGIRQRLEGEIAALTDPVDMDWVKAFGWPA